MTSKNEQALEGVGLEALFLKGLILVHPARLERATF